MSRALAAVCLAFTCLAAAGADLRVAAAAKSGSLDQIRALIAQRVDVNAAEADGTTALHWAVRRDDVETVRVLLTAGAKADASNRYGVTPVALAAVNGSAPALAALLDAGADPNTASPEGETVLMTAARTGNAGAVRLLLARGARVDARERWYEQTALMWAAAENHAGAIAVLLEHGADVDARAAVLEGEPKREIVDFRTGKDGLALQALLTSFPRGGQTPLLFAARDGSLEAAQALLTAGANVNLADPDGMSPLTLAILNGHFEVAALLIERGADVSASEPTGRTPLWAAIDMHTVEWVPNRPAPKRRGPLDSLAIARMLLERGASPDPRLARGVPPRKADAANHPLLGAGATPLMRAAVSADVAAMRLLLDHGASATAVTGNGTSALLLAAGLGWRDLYGQGTEQRAIDAITLCLERGADVNAANEQGNTAMHGAAARGGNAIVEFLVSRGARVDVKNKRGRTPRDEALEFRPSRDATAALLQRLMNRAGA